MDAADSISPIDDVWVDVGLGQYMSEKPSARFPIYTRGNAGEVYPQVMYPLSHSLSRDTNGRSFHTAIMQTGMATEAEVAEGSVVFAGCFGGYTYLNLSINRLIATRTPNATIEDSDATYLGSEGVAPPHVPQKGDRNIGASVRGLRYAWKHLKAKDLPHLAVDQEVVAAWERRLPELTEADDVTLIAAGRDLMEPLTELFTNHLRVTGMAGAAMQLVGQMCEEKLDDRSLVLTLLGGLGDVDSAAPSFALWDLGRMVVGSPELTAAFDAGLNGLGARLEAGAGVDHEAFLDAFAAFLAEFGSRGPNEWETGVDTWGTDPSMPLALIDRMRGGDDRHAPRARTEALAAKRSIAVADARARLRWPTRVFFNRFLHAATMYSQGRERSKTTIVELIHVGRLLQREVARRAAAKVEGGTIEDMWFVTDDQLEAYVADPVSFGGIVAERRRVRTELSRRVPPFVFEGAISPASEWPLRAELAAETATLGVGDVITGAGGCPGVAEGRARVVTDPTNPGDIGPGDVLIAPLTDPAWTPLFVPVEAVVVNVGGQMSHAVIVARELGMPCVVAATDATTKIPDGALVRVDGGAGTVTVLDEGES